MIQMASFEEVLGRIMFEHERPFLALLYKFLTSTRGIQ